jgi:hypothetical protein
MDGSVPETCRPVWNLVLNNNNFREWRSLFDKLAESDRPFMLRVTASAPSAILGDVTASQLAFRRLQDLFAQAGKASKLHALADAAEQATRELETLEDGMGSPDPLARFSQTSATLKAWSDRVEELVGMQGVVPTLRVFV